MAQRCDARDVRFVYHDGITARQPRHNSAVKVVQLGFAAAGGLYNVWSSPVPSQLVGPRLHLFQNRRPYFRFLILEYCKRSRLITPCFISPPGNAPTSRQRLLSAAP